jgi:hypothetical protein
VNRTFVVTFALACAVAVPLAYFGFTPLAIDGVVVTSKPSCDDSMDTATQVSSKWESGLLLVDISEAQTCGESQQSVDVQRLGSNLFVRTMYASETGEVAACICRQNFSLAVPGVPEQSYTVAVYNLP